MWLDKVLVCLVAATAPVAIFLSCDRPINYVPRYPESSAVTPPEIAPNNALSDPCAKACKRLLDLGCKEGMTTEGGSTCYDVCFHVENSGVARFCPVEISKINSCAEMETAFRSCDSRAR